MLSPHVPAPLAVAALCSAVVADAATTVAAPAEKRTFNLPRGDAAVTLKQFASAAGTPIVYLVDRVRGAATNAVSGEFAPRDALERMLAGSALEAAQDAATGALVVSRKHVAEIAPRPGEVGPVSDPQPQPRAKSMIHKPRPLLVALLGLIIGSSPGSHAADGPSSTIEGRVYNADSGDYLNNARVSLEGSTQEVRTNSSGEYRLGPVPAGTVSVRVNVSGYAPKTASVAVAPGAPAALNFGLKLDTRQSGSDTDAVVLDSFVVAAQREMSGSAVAINERRAAANLRNVVAADEFGDSTEGNVGEFVKYIPAVAIDYTSAEPRFISVRGLPSFGTAVMIDGNRMASAAAGFSRAAELDQVSLNNMSRIEVTKSPTPDTPADTIGGSVNMVLKSAFERAKPVFNYRVNLNANFSDVPGMDLVSLRKSPGPAYERTAKIKPGFDFNYINPVNKTLGYTLSVMTSNQFTPELRTTPQWRPVATASSLASADRPFLNSLTVGDWPKEVYRWSFGATLDWRVTPRDVLSLAGQWNSFDTTAMNYDHSFDATASRSVLPASYGPTFLESATAASIVRHNTVYQHKVGVGYNLRLTHRHTGPVWNLENGAAYSSSVSEFKGAEDGAVRTVSAVIRNATVRFDDIRESRPGAIAVRNTAGAPVDYRQLDSYTLDTVTLAPSKQISVTTSAFANAVRQFEGPLAFRLKTGVDVRREDRDFRNPTNTWTFVGPDRIANTADDSASRYGVLFDDYVGVPQPFGYGMLQRPSNAKVYALLTEHPEYFTLNDVTAISSAATQSRKLTETVAAGFIRGDINLFRNRLKLVGGVRYEETFDQGQGVLNDIRATYQRDANGRIVRDSTGRPVRLTTDPVALARLQYTDRGATAKRNYGDFYPSLNATFQITEQLLLRASYAETITRPQLSNIVPSVTATDPTVTTGTFTITVSNTALKPWSSKSYDLALEYYFEQPGLVSLGVFKKDIRDFFGSVRLPSTPALLAEFGFDDSYLGYDIVTRENAGDASVSGIEFEYRQTLTFLPAWAKGVSIFANGTTLHLEGASTADFSGFISKTANWGISLSRPRYTVKANWNLRGRQRLAAVTGVNVPAGTYQYRNPRLTLDLNAEWRVTPRITLFANLRNVTNVTWRTESYGPDTPAYARETISVQYGAQGIFGIKGSF